MSKIRIALPSSAPTAIGRGGDLLTDTLALIVTREEAL